MSKVQIYAENVHFFGFILLLRSLAICPTIIAKIQTTAAQHFFVYCPWIKNRKTEDISKFLKLQKFQSISNNFYVNFPSIDSEFSYSIVRWHRPGKVINFDFFAAGKLFFSHILWILDEGRCNLSHMESLRSSCENTIKVYRQSC